MKERKKYRVPLIAGALLALLALLVFVVLPLGIRYSLSRWLLSSGADTAIISRVRINPFLGTMSLEGITVKVGDATVLSDSDLQVDIGMLALLKKEAILEKSTLVGVSVDMELYEDGRLRIGSYTTEPGNSDKKSESKTPWLFAANRIEMNNCSIHFKMPDLDLNLQIDKAELVKFTTAPGDKSGSFRLSGTINGTPLLIDLETLRILPDIVAMGTINVQGFGLENLAQLLDPTLAPFHGTASIDGKVQFTMNDLGDITVDYEGMLEVTKGDIGGATYRVKGAPVRWPHGTIHFAMTGENGIEVDVNGNLTGKDVEVMLPAPRLHVRGPGVDISGQVKVHVADQVKVDARAAVILDNPALDMDALQITAKKLAWQGGKPQVLFLSGGDTGQPLSVTALGRFLATDYAISVRPRDSGSGPMNTAGRELVYDGQARYRAGGAKSAAGIRTDGTLTGRNISLGLADVMELRQQFIEHRGKVDVSLAQTGLSLTLDDRLIGEKLSILLTESGLNIRQNKFATAHKGTIALEDNLHIKGTASIDANGFSVVQAQTKTPLLDLGRLALQKAEAPTDNQLSVAGIRAEQLIYHLGGAMPMTITLPEVMVKTVKSDDLTNWSVGSVTAQKPVAISTRSRQRLAGLGSLEMRSVNVNKNLQVSVDRVHFDDLFFLKPAEKNSPAICTIGGARLSKIGWLPDKGLHGASLSFADLYCNIIRNKDGSLILSKELVAMRDPDAAKKEADTTKKSTEKNMPIRLDKVTLRGKSGLHFEDHTLAIPFISNLDIKTFQIGGLDSGQPDRPATLRMKGTLEKRAPLSIRGTISPFADPLAMHLNLVLKNYPLKHLSAYTVQSVGVALASGSLRIDSDINLAENKLDMKNKVLLKQLKTSTISKDLAAKLDNQLPIPLDSALSILRDRDDTIKLDVPISGPLDKLNVGIADILITALGKAIVPAASGYLVYALGPYGALAWVGMELGSRMMAVKLPPVLFEPGRTELSDTIDDYFSRLAKILQDKPETDFRLCPKTSAWELMEKEKKEGKEASELPAEMKKQLKELGQKRAATIKEHLVEKYGVDESRLLVCTTEIETKKSAKPRVEIRM